MERWKQIATCICAGLVCAYIVFCISYFSERRLNPVCNNFEVRFLDSHQRQFVSTSEMQQFIRRTGIKLEDEPISSQRCQQIEEHALQHPMIRKAKCYCSPDGTVHLRLQQRIPVFRVLGADNYYIDSDRRLMFTRTTTATYVPIVTGRVSQHLAQGELYDFVRWLEKDKFWSAQITQINIVDAEHIELIPRIGTGTIMLGNLSDYEKKLEKLQTLYTEGFSKFGWKEYKEIDLRFRGQIVCR